MTPSHDLTDDSEGLSHQQASVIREHLQEILSSPEFSGSKRAQKFLQLLIEHTLADAPESLKERMIGAEMFGRPIDYDTGNDAVVRVKATEIRRRLALFYGRVSEPKVRIELPVGSYVLKFIWPTAEQVSTGREQSATTKPESPIAHSKPSALKRILRKEWVIGSAMILLLAVGGLFVLERWKESRAVEPIRSIAILPLINLSVDSNQDYFADGMTEELIAEMGRCRNCGSSREPRR